MKIIIVEILFVFIFVLSANAQDNSSPRAIYDRNNNMVAMYNIGTNLDANEIEFCSVEKYIGNLTSISKDYPNVEVIIQTKKRKEYISLNTESMSMADRSNFFYSLLRKGKRVEIGAYMCGSGGFLYATSVRSIPATASKRKKK